jgi:hypothetical protein
MIKNKMKKGKNVKQLKIVVCANTILVILKLSVKRITEL